MSTYNLLHAGHEAEFAALAAQNFCALLETLSNPLVTLPTGMTPQGFYQALIRDYGARAPLWDDVRFVALDEYMGLPLDDARLFGTWLQNACLTPLGIRQAMFFKSNADPATEITRMQQWLAQNGPLDVAVLGLGQNGHVAFNEPGTPFEAGVHTMDLTAQSIEANARYWGGAARVPRHGITLGLGDLAQARHTILLVKGREKAAMLKAALTGPVTTDVPASYLQTIKNVTIIADNDAASLL